MNARTQVYVPFACRLAGCLSLLLAGCASVPATHMLLPGSSPPVREALPAVGARAHVLTVAGDEQDLQVLASTPADISGTDSQAAAVHVPMDDVAVAYYRNPTRKVGPNGLPAPDTNRLPRMKSAGVVEAGLSCAALDTELARVEAVHGYLRHSGFQPYTPGQQFARHARNAAFYTAVTVFIVAACSAGCSGISFPDSTRAAAPDEQAFRWALTSTDDRLQALLALKARRACPGRRTLDAMHSDVELWSAFTTSAEGSTSPSATSVRDHRTRVFDLLGPKPVGALAATGTE